MARITRRAALRAIVAGVALLGAAVAAACQPFRGPDTGGSGMMGSGSGGRMMGNATSADMSTYMDMFNRHTEIRRTVEEIPGGVRTTTESDVPALTAQIQAHVSSMYGHLQQGAEVTCGSQSLPTLFRNASGYRRQLTITGKGVTVVETSSDPTLVKAIREHAREVSGFVRDGMPAMMQGMMGG